MEFRVEGEYLRMRDSRSGERYLFDGELRQDREASKAKVETAEVKVDAVETRIAELEAQLRQARNSVGENP